MAARKRTTHRSRIGSKLYAKRGAQGEFEDVQTYERAHGQDVKRVSKAETAARKASGKPARKKASTARESTATKKSATARKSATKKKSAAKKKTGAKRKTAARKK